MRAVKIHAGAIVIATPVCLVVSYAVILTGESVAEEKLFDAHGIAGDLVP
jgi:hypothetical protein